MSAAARATRDQNVSAHDAALKTDLADTYAAALEQLALDHPTPWSTRAAADARTESDRTTAEQSAQTTLDSAILSASAAFETTQADAEQTQSESQTDALGTLKTTNSNAAFDNATNEAANDSAAAGVGVGTEPTPTQQTPPAGPEDVPAVIDSITSTCNNLIDAITSKRRSESAALIGQKVQRSGFRVSILTWWEVA